MRPRTPSDSTLLASGKASDFGAFYDRHLGGVTAFVGRRVREPEVIFDLVAETFARALEHRAQYDEERGPAIGWLIGIARNLILDAVRRGQVEAASRIRLGMEPVELEDEQLELISERGSIDLRAALASLPADQRDGVLRRVVLDEGYTTIASDLRCSEQVARKRVSRGLAARRTSLGGER
jgi:RNA polymerase sigma factor (sigma-70 family)